MRLCLPEPGARQCTGADRRCLRRGEALHGGACVERQRPDDERHGTRTGDGGHGRGLVELYPCKLPAGRRRQNHRNAGSGPGAGAGTGAGTGAGRRRRNHRNAGPGPGKRRDELHLRSQRPAHRRGMEGSRSTGGGHFPAPQLWCLRRFCG